MHSKRLVGVSYYDDERDWRMTSAFREPARAQEPARHLENMSSKPHSGPTRRGGETHEEDAG